MPGREVVNEKTLGSSQIPTKEQEQQAGAGIIGQLPFDRGQRIKASQPRKHVLVGPVRPTRKMLTATRDSKGHDLRA